MRKIYYSYLLPFGTICLLLLVSLVLLQTQLFAQGPDAAWQYSRPINLTSPTTLADYQVRVTLTTATMGNPYTNINADGSDLRFFDANDNACAYWIEKWDRIGTSIVWVKLPSTGSFMTMYYGNANATSASSGVNTFDWFEDFDSLPANKWATLTANGGTVAQSGSTVTVATNQNSSGSALISNTNPFITGSPTFFLETKHREKGYFRNRFYATTASKGSSPTGFDYGYFTNSGTPPLAEGKIFWNSAKNNSYPPISLLFNNTDYITRWQITDGAAYRWSTLHANDYTLLEAPKATTVAYQIRYITIHANEKDSTSIAVDWVRVRKSQATEPDASVGTETDRRPHITSLGSTSACVGGSITINGKNLAGATTENVKIGGTPVVQFLLKEDNKIVAQVGNGTTGHVTITINGITAESGEPFTVNKFTPGDLYTVNGGGCLFAGSPGLTVGLNGSQLGANYMLFRDGEAVSPARTMAGTGSPISFDNLDVPGVYTIHAQLGTCSEIMKGTAVIHDVPEIKIVPSQTTFCQGTIVSLTASPATETGTTLAKSNSTASSIPVPDNNPAGVSRSLAIAGIPVEAVITGVSIRFRITHPKVSDLVINLKGPNGRVLNIANKIGGNGANFGSGGTNTIIDNFSNTHITSGTAPFTSGPYAPQASGGIIGATSVPGNVSNTGSLSGLYGMSGASANGNWILSVSDGVAGNSGSVQYFEVTVTYTMVNNAIPAKWSPSSDLFLDAAATIPYNGAPASTVYARPSGSTTYSASHVDANSCPVSATTLLTVNPSPSLAISTNYCDHPGVVRITAKSSMPVSGWIWSNGSTTGTVDSSYIDVNVAGTYYVSARASGNACPVSASMGVAQELVTNGNFEQGNTGFESGYFFQEDDPLRNTELVDDKNPANNGYGIGANGQDYHNNFWGTDHTYGTGTGKFMIINGHGNLIVWENKNVPVLPNTTYYFSAWGMSLNNKGPFAELKFEIDGEGTYNDNFTAKLDTGYSGNANNGWKKFYGNWTSGPGTTSVDISIVNLVGALEGNDFGLDDISFGTLISFFSMTSDERTDHQSGVCVGTPIDDIVYEIGGDGKAPIISGTLPAGVTASWDGRTYRISGTPTEVGAFQATIESSGCNKQSKQVTIEVIESSEAGAIVGGPLISACYGSGGTLTVEGARGGIQWQTSIDSINWTNVSSGDFADLQSPIFYRVLAQNTQTCRVDSSLPVKVAVKNLWVGERNTDWHTAANWSDKNPPTTSCDNVIIPKATTFRYPVLTAGTTQVNHLIIRPDASLTVRNPAVLQVSGDISSDGALDLTDGTLELNGSLPQTISGSYFKDTTIRRLIVSNPSVNVASPGRSLAISDKISFGSADGQLNSQGNITLMSTRYKTASLGELGPANSVTGDFTIERYINVGPDSGQHRKKWIFLATPASGQTIRQSWMENGRSPEGYGIMLSGPLGENAGWDRSSPAPAIKSYDPSTNLWKGAANANVPLNNAAGWMTFIRGDRSVSYDSDPITNTVLRSKGTLKTHDQVFPLAMTDDGFMAIGNPYPSAIDMREIRDGAGNPITAFYFWNPNATSTDPALSYGLGAYQTATLIGGGYQIVPGDSTVNYILSGQAFFVQAGSGYEPLRIAESMKTDEEANTTYFRAMNNTAAMLKTNLFVDNGHLLDGAVQIFGRDYSNAVDHMDARKMLNSGVNLAVKVSDKLLVVERKQPILPADTIVFNLAGIQTGTYSFAFDANNLAVPGLEAWLEDGFTKLRTPVNLEGNTEIGFEVTSAAASKAADRFRIVFAGQGALPVTFVKMNAARDGKNVKVQWSVANEVNVERYMVMASVNGTDFTDIGSVNATDAGEYVFTHQMPAAGYHYYRVRSVDRDGKFAYSNTVKVFVGANEPLLRVFPNPITHGHINLKMENHPAGKYQIRLVDPAGKVVLSRSADHAGGTNTIRLPWDYNMAHGNYNLEVSYPDGSTKVIVVMY